jgi:hypothetical protein
MKAQPRIRHIYGILIGLTAARLSPVILAAEPVEIGSRRELFVDRHLIDRLDGARLNRRALSDAQEKQIGIPEPPFTWRLARAWPLVPTFVSQFKLMVCQIRVRSSLILSGT